MKPTDILLLWDAGCIDDDKLMLLLCGDKEQPYYQKYDRFELDNLDNLECKNLFRFNKDHLPLLCSELCLDEEYLSSTHLKWTSLEGLCVMLHRLAYPNRLSDLVPIFGRSKSKCLIIFNTMLNDLIVHHHHRVTTVSQPWLNHLQMAQVIRTKGAVIDNVWAFIDGTHILIC